MKDVLSAEVADFLNAGKNSYQQSAISVRYGRGTAITGNFVRFS